MTPEPSPPIGWVGVYRLMHVPLPDGGRYTPINYGRLDGRQVVIDTCTVCGSTHRHGAVGFDSPGDTDTRAPHCGLADEPIEYKIVLEGSE